METDEEKTCLSSLLEDPLLHISLFNEPSANLAWCEVRLAGISSSVAAMIARSEPQLADPKLKAEIGPQLDLLSDPELQKGAINLPVNLKWQPVDVNYLTTGMRVSTLSLFDRDEGAQQEEVAVWIMDSLLGGIPAVRSPQVRLASGIRELTDVLVSHDKGAFLIESKTLSLLSRSELPNREKLSRGLRKHVVKAGKQLVGAATSIRQAIRITDAAGVELPVHARELLHAIILVPDLNLLADANDFGAEYFRRMTVSLGGGFFNILDPAELLSMVQMAEATSRRLGTVDQIAVLDGLLFFRATISLTKRTPDFRFRLRGSDEAPE
jgi:hypothetical protein